MTIRSAGAGRRVPTMALAVWVSVTGLGAGVARADELKVFSAGAVRAIVTELAQVFRQETGHTVALSFGTVEVRICDAQTRGDEGFALAGLIAACIAQTALDYDERGYDGAGRPLADWIRAHGTRVGAALWSGATAGLGRASRRQLYDLKPEAGLVPAS